MPPPKLARNAPVAERFQPLAVGFHIAIGHEAHAISRAFFHRREGGFGQRLHVHIPLAQQGGFDHVARAVAQRNIDEAVFDGNQKPQGFQFRHQFFARREALHARIGSGFMVQRGIEVHGHDGFQVVPLTHFIIVEVMRGRDFHRTRSLGGIGMLVGDNGNGPVDDGD